MQFFYAMAYSLLSKRKDFGKAAVSGAGVLTRTVSHEKGPSSPSSISHPSDG
jgi:hypothetical protein